MILFLCLAAIIVVSAALLLAWSIRRGTPPAADRERLNVAIFRDRLAELDAERDAGRLDAAQHAALAGELQRLLVDDVTVAPEAVAARSRFVAPLVLVLLPLLAFAIYAATGFDAASRDWIALRGKAATVAAMPHPLTAEVASAHGFALEDAARVRLATLGRAPSDAEAWFSLGITWLELQAPTLALESLRTARRLAPQRVDITVALARVELALNGGRLDEEVRGLLDGVLAIEPAHQGVLMVYGMAAFEGGDYTLAAAKWRVLLGQLVPGSEGAAMLTKTIAVAEQRAQQSAAGGLRVRVTWADTLGAVPDGATLFVSARAADGPPMPLAARKLTPAFPADVTLSDADVVMPGATLAGVGALSLRARVSLSGTPMPQSGDYESDAVVVAPGADLPVNLAIKRRIP